MIKEDRDGSESKRVLLTRHVLNVSCATDGGSRKRDGGCARDKCGYQESKRVIILGRSCRISSGQVIPRVQVIPLAKTFPQSKREIPWKPRDT